MSSVRSTRPYRMRERADQVRETRRRITKAAVSLHATVGPARTSIRAVAEEAGVSRATVYRHFRDEEELFAACMGHFEAVNPPPDVDSWLSIPTFEERARHALTELYGYYGENAGELDPIHRDLHALPARTQRAMRASDGALADALIAGCGLRGRRRDRLRAVAGHLVDFGTWRSLVSDHGLDSREAVEVACRFLELVAADDRAT